MSAKTLIIAGVIIVVLSVLGVISGIYSRSAGAQDSVINYALGNAAVGVLGIVVLIIGVVGNRKKDK